VVAVSQGEIWWADLPEPIGSGPGFRRPIVIVQDDAFNHSRLGTVIGVLITGNVTRAESPGNVLLTSRATGLPHDSVANVSQIVTIDKRVLMERTGRLSRANLELVLSGINVVLGR
jgi:mRNA interferase MazF